MASSMLSCNMHNGVAPTFMKQVLVIDIGNSNIVIGLMHDGEVDGVVRLETLIDEGETSLYTRLQDALTELGAVNNQPAGAILASVVPALTPLVMRSIYHLTGL